MTAHNSTSQTHLEHHFGGKGSGMCSDCNYNAIFKTRENKILLGERRTRMKIYVLFMDSDLASIIISTFSFTFLLSFSFACSSNQVGLEVAHPGVSNDFNDEGEKSFCGN